MATLTETAYYLRRLIKFGLIGVCVFLVFRAAYGRIVEYWAAAHPTPPPKPTMAFGKLPKIPFPPQEKKESVFKLETISGNLPDLPDQVKVFFIPKGEPQFATLDRAKTKAANLGFKEKPIKVSESVYRWLEQNNLFSILEMDILSGDFEITRNWQDNPAFLASNQPIIEDKAISQVRNYLSKANLLSDRLAQGQAKVSYLKFSVPSLVPAVSFSEAELTRLDFFSAPLDNLPLMPPNPNKALVSFLLRAADKEEEKFLQVQYHHQPILEQRFAAYPLKTTAQAWSELRAGNAFIIPGQANPQNIVIREIFLAYFEAETPTNYLMPIFVFQGDQNFYAYVSAISDQWLQE